MKHRSLTLPKPLTRKRTIHIINRILITISQPTNRPISRIPSPIRACRRPRGRPRRPAQSPIVKLHVIIFVLTRNDDGIGELAVETVRVGGVDRVADRVGGGIGEGLTDDGFVVVVKGDDGVEIGGVGGAVLGFSQMERAGSCCVGLGWSRGGGGCCCCCDWGWLGRCGSAG